jgi:hypothetical protein
MVEMKKTAKSRLRVFLTLALLGLLLINLTFISAYVIIGKLFGKMTLYPGEEYTMNIPFLGPSKSPMICGKAEQNDGTLISGVRVIAKYINGTVAGEDTTSSDGEYCITLPEIKTTNQQYNIYLDYDNETSKGNIILGSNNYYLNFKDDEVCNKSIDDYAILKGNITNEDAKVEDGRFEIKVRHRKNVVNGTWIDITEYQKYLVNINPNEIYEVPNEELNVSWKIPSDAERGEYKFLIKTSFNAEEKTSQTVFFNVTT